MVLINTKYVKVLLTTVQFSIILILFSDSPSSYSLLASSYSHIQTNAQLHFSSVPENL